MIMAGESQDELLTAKIIISIILLVMGLLCGFVPIFM